MNNMHRRIVVLILLLLILALEACSSNKMENEKVEYINITAQEAKELMDTETEYIILDVRTPQEYELGYIKGAILIPDYEIDERAENELSNKEQLILVYCRSGNRSKKAAKELASLGYTNIKEFGGIIGWPYDIEK